MSDPLSDILSFLNARSFVSAGLRAGGEWAIKVTPTSGLQFSAVLRGSASIQLDHADTALELEKGDSFLVTGGSGFILGNNLRSDTPILADELFSSTQDGIARIEPADTCHFIGGSMSFDSIEEQLLLDALPPLIHIAAASQSGRTLAWLTAKLAEEVADGRPGSDAMGRQLIHMIFIEAIRTQFVHSEANDPGWVRGLSDPRIARVLKAIHSEPQRPWSHGELAEIAGMSRSAFSARFRVLIGIPPLEYRLQWRIRLARHELRTSRVSISQIAFRAGYFSESAFSAAFSRLTGESPRSYRTRIHHEAGEDRSCTSRQVGQETPQPS